MRWIGVLLMFVFCALAAAEEPQKKLLLMFFMKGDGPRPADKAVLQKMQDDHIANLVKQNKAGNLLAAGPLDDPTGMRRGITVGWAASLEELESFFKDDPYVKAKIMTIKASVWNVNPKMFHADPNEKEMVGYQLVLFRPGLSKRPVSEAMMKEHAQYLSAMQGWLVGGNGGTEAHIFTNEDKSALEARLRDVPLVKANLLACEVLPLYALKGLFGRKPGG